MLFAAQVFLWLMFYSFAGWVYESILCSITGGKLVNRGFLNGPICPIYGFGALTIIFVGGTVGEQPGRGVPFERGAGLHAGILHLLGDGKALSRTLVGLQLDAF